MNTRLRLTLLLVLAVAVVLLCGCRVYYDPWNDLYLEIDELEEWWNVYSPDMAFDIFGAMGVVHQNRFSTVYRGTGETYDTDFLFPIRGVRVWIFEDHWRGRVTAWLYVPGGPTVRIHGFLSEDPEVE